VVKKYPTLIYIQFTINISKKFLAQQFYKAKFWQKMKWHLISGHGVYMNYVMILNYFFIAHLLLSVMVK